ncbi:MAG: Do family serine endopeptidase [Janthinobacterium lividum]
MLNYQTNKIRSALLLSSVFVSLISTFNSHHARAGITLSKPSVAPPNFADIVEPLQSAVVNISTMTEIPRNRIPMEMPNFPSGSPLEELFRHFQEGPQSRPRKTASLGSGFIISQEGNEAFIVTCNHVVEDADKITIILDDADKNEYEAQVVGRDPRTDIALLKIKTDKKLTTVSWGDASKSRVGEWVIAIGNPYGLSSTVTHGIISTIARDISIRAPNSATADYVPGYFQIDASINVGNSGGPIFNINGQVIGVNTAILSPNGGSIGIGFAIPETTAKAVVEQLKKYGRTKRGWLGVGIQPVTEDVAQSLGLKKPMGALVSYIYPSGPATPAGLKNGDIILSLNNQAVKESRLLPRIAGEAPIGSKTPIVVWRNGQEVKLEITIGEFEEAEKEGLISTDDIDDKKIDKTQNRLTLGMAFQVIKPSQYERYGMTEDKRGLLIVYVDPESEAADKGIRPGNVLMEIISENIHEKITDTKQLKSFVDNVRKNGKKVVLLSINQGKSPRYVALSLEEPIDEKDKDADKEKAKEPETTNKNKESDNTKEKNR